MSELEKKALATLKAVKKLQFNINMEVLDSVDHCISELEASNEKNSPQSLKTKKIAPEKIEKKPPTREELNKMSYWNLRKEYSIDGEKGLKKDEIIEIILQRSEG